jgi:Arc/MetJ family transcription regulator
MLSRAEIAADKADILERIQKVETTLVAEFRKRVISFESETVALDEDLIQKAQEYTGITERTALFREALKALIHHEASRRLALLGGTMPDLEDIPRTRVDLGPE